MGPNLQELSTYLMGGHVLPPPPLLVGQSFVPPTEGWGEAREGEMKAMISIIKPVIDSW